jgi:hypothetical protein
MRRPFRRDEQKIMDLLCDAHNRFLKLKRMHPAELTEWIPAFHNLQHIISMRILQREYPEYFIIKQSKNQ